MTIMLFGAVGTLVSWAVISFGMSDNLTQFLVICNVEVLTRKMSVHMSFNPLCTDMTETETSLKAYFIFSIPPFT